MACCCIVVSKGSLKIHESFLHCLFYFIIQSASSCHNSQAIKFLNKKFMKLAEFSFCSGLLPENSLQFLLRILDRPTMLGVSCDIHSRILNTMQNLHERNYPRNRMPHPHVNITSTSTLFLIHTLSLPCEANFFFSSIFLFRKSSKTLRVLMISKAAVVIIEILSHCKFTLKISTKKSQNEPNA